MARTRQAAKKATGGKKPRSTTKNNVNNNNITRPNPKKTKKSKKSNKSAAGEKKKCPRSPFRIRRIIRISKSSYDSVYDHTGEKNFINQWNRDYWRIANMIGARFKITTKIYWHVNKLFVAAADRFDIKTRQRIERFLCNKFHYLDEGIATGSVQLQFCTLDRLAELEEEHGIVECDEEERANYRKHRKTNLFVNQ